MDVPRRTVQFLELGEEIVIVSLVCEDLAQEDSVAEIIRSVGPTIVYTPLLDGPQLTSRWTARYASVLADDPGSAVLTLTSFGMAQRCRPRGHDPSSVVALWKCPDPGTHEISLDEGAHGVLLTVCGDRGARRTTDGRWPIQNATRYFEVAIHQIRATPSSSRAPKVLPNADIPQSLSVEEITVVTSFAQAMAEALTYSPGCVETLLADSRRDAEWRKEFGIAEPSRQLGAALELVDQTIRAASPPGNPPTFTAVLAAVREEPQSESTLQRVVRRVLRSTLEQRQLRQPPDP